MKDLLAFLFLEGLFAAMMYWGGYLGGFNAAQAGMDQAAFNYYCASPGHSETLCQSPAGMAVTSEEDQ